MTAPIIRDFIDCNRRTVYLCEPYRFLVRPRERLRSIVMSMSVSVSVCLSVREDIFGTTRAIFTNNFVHVVRGSVLLRHVDDRPHRLSAGRG